MFHGSAERYHKLTDRSCETRQMLSPEEYESYFFEAATAAYDSRLSDFDLELGEIICRRLQRSITSLIDKSVLSIKENMD